MKFHRKRLCLAYSIAVVAGIVMTARAHTLQQSVPGGPGFHFGRAVHVTTDQNNDGFPDVLVGAPGSNGGNGSIRCLSGKFLATAIGNSELWSLTPSVPTDAGFGASIVEVASLTGNSATDYLVGAPEYKAGFFCDGRADPGRRRDAHGGCDDGGLSQHSRRRISRCDR